MNHLPSPPTSITHLSNSLTSTVPLQYISRDPKATSDVDPTLESEIPIIDHSMLISGNHEQRAKTVSELGRACQDWGFFMVVNHPVTKEFMDLMINTSKEFFYMEEDDKREYANWKHVLDRIRYGTSFNTNVDDVRYWRDYLTVSVHPELHSPTKPSTFRDVLQEYTSCCRALAMDLLGGIWESLGLEERHMRQVLDLDSCYQHFVANYYPPCPQPELTMGFPAHSDYGLLTLLCQDGPNALEIKHGSKWVKVKPLLGTIMVNTGDHMEIVTNGRYKSVVHRATVSGQSARISIVAAVSPSLDTVVEPIQQLISYENPPLFRGISFQDYLRCKMENQLKGKSTLDLLRI